MHRRRSLLLVKCARPECCYHLFPGKSVKCPTCKVDYCYHTCLHLDADRHQRYACANTREERIQKHLRYSLPDEENPLLEWNPQERRFEKTYCLICAMPSCTREECHRWSLRCPVSHLRVTPKHDFCSRFTQRILLLVLYRSEGVPRLPRVLRSYLYYYFIRCVHQLP